MLSPPSQRLSPVAHTAASSQANLLSSSAPGPGSSKVLIGLDHIFSSFLMKMEVLSVQSHHIQKQFGVVGSTKVKTDWTSSLKRPSSRSPTIPSTTPLATTAAYNAQQSPIEHFDVVEGLNPQRSTAASFATTSTHTTNSAHHENPHHHHSQNFNMKTATAASATPKGGTEATGSTHCVHNNTLLYCNPKRINVATNMPATAVPTTVRSPTPYHSAFTGIPTTSLTPSPTASNLSTSTEATEHFGIAYDDIDAAAVNELSQRLQDELRAAKSRHLSCTEVSLPWDLTPRIAAAMIKTSEREPCGVRGCAIFIDFEDERGSTRRISSFKVDPNTVSTFELFLTLKQDKSGWTSLLPQFLKNLTRSSSILISPHFTLNKHKLYACE